MGESLASVLGGKGKERQVPKSAVLLVVRWGGLPKPRALESTGQGGTRELEQEIKVFAFHVVNPKLIPAPLWSLESCQE